MRNPARPSATADETTPTVTVLIEVPRWSFLKRGSTGEIDFVSPLPCPFNYGAVPAFIGREGDLLDALVLGPRLPLGRRVSVRAYASIALTDRGMTDDKLVCGHHPPTAAELRRVERFFRFYAHCKALLNRYRGRPGRNAFDGWDDAAAAIARAQPRGPEWTPPQVPF
ncbi:inorganic diphosphatase [Alkalilimnicola ehrlichii MLHE-1]|uniref:inorganic diphosphatase n=1 Tax=Alkalilimnicola ehrlichii (strain ATCC BAA-1101 / DSM 17681 / MLHE-1) TaxID=187272 RepID=Q0ACG9_ALKEH|nr:inorganic diphosphatase [Alkalilimnicola ehrlichii]ABI55468.1 Inorganic pyrophosphatase [Alkalilimnicola ehrlichii MLHE-1]